MATEKRRRFPISITFKNLSLRHAGAEKRSKNRRCLGTTGHQPEVRRAQRCDQGRVRAKRSGVEGEAAGADLHESCECIHMMTKRRRHDIFGSRQFRLPVCYEGLSVWKNTGLLDTRVCGRGSLELPRNGNISRYCGEESSCYVCSGSV